MKDLMAAHHNLGLLHYYMQYRHLPHELREDPNPGKEGAPCVPHTLPVCCMVPTAHLLLCAHLPLCQVAQTLIHGTTQQLQNR